MTTAHISQQGRVHTVAVYGHSMFEASGKDVVCAGISSIVNAFWNTICELNDKNEVMTTFEEIDEGEVRLEYVGDAGTAELMLLEGLRLLESQFPRNLKVFYSKE